MPTDPPHVTTVAQHPRRLDIDMDYRCLTSALFIALLAAQRLGLDAVIASLYELHADAVRRQRQHEDEAAA